MTTSENRSWAFVGPLTVALWIVGLALLTHKGPPDHATGSEVLGWYRTHTTTIILGGWLFMLGCLGFVTFVSGLRVRLSEAAGQASQLPGLALVGAGMAAGFGMLVAAVDVGGGIDKSEINPTTAVALHNAVNIFFVCAELAAILPLAAVAIVAWRTRILPRWWACVSGFVAVLLVVGPIGWLAVIFGLPLWTLGTSLFVLLRSPERIGAAAATATA
jgi:hypothetical protein